MPTYVGEVKIAAAGLVTQTRRMVSYVDVSREDFKRWYAEALNIAFLGRFR